MLVLSTPAGARQQDSTLNNAARGAAPGAVIGGIADDAGKGAAAGFVLDGVRRR